MKKEHSIIIVLISIILMGGMIFFNQKKDNNITPISTTNNTQQNDVLNKKLEVVQTTPNINFQAECANQAEKTIKNYLQKLDDIFYDQTGQRNEYFQLDKYNLQSHFNSKLNKCFVLMSRNNNDNLFDAYENFSLGSCDTSKKSSGNSCWLGELGNNLSRISYKEYTDFVNQRMERQVYVYQAPPSIPKFNKDIPLYSEGPDVANIEQFLGYEDIFKGSVWGIFDASLSDDIIKFEKKYSISAANGVWGLQDRTKANEIMAQNPSLYVITDDNKYKP
jgi:hypothetical protein